MNKASFSLPALLGLGGFVPEKVLDNETLTRMVDTSDEWITTRTGIHERRILEPGLGGSFMAEKASRAALADAGLEAAALTHIVYSTCTPDAMCPPTSCTLSDKLGVTNIFALDINAACSTFVYGLSVVRGLLLAEPGAVILLVASDVMSSRVNWEDRSTCVLFGDAAGAAVFTSGKKGRGMLVDVEVSSRGDLGPLLQINGGGSAHPARLGDVVGPDYFIRMEGREVYKHAVRNMTASCRNIMERNGLSLDDIDLFIPHQANMRIIEGVGSRLEVPEGKLYVNVDMRGNTSSASIPLALAEADRAGRIKPGMKVLITTFGGGLTWGSALLAF